MDEARARRLVDLAQDAGIRASELVGLKVGDVHFRSGYFVVRGKGNKQRSVPMGRICQALLNRYIRRQRPEPTRPTVANLFLTQHGRPITQDWVYKIVARTCRGLGIRGKRLGPHACRHTFAKRFLMNGGDLLLRDHYPPPPYSHRLTCSEEFRLSPLESVVSALMQIPPPNPGLYLVLFQPVSPDHNWHANVDLLLDL